MKFKPALDVRGLFFAYEHYDVVPDIVTCGKGIGSGYPLAAMLAKEHCNVFEPGEQGEPIPHNLLE